MEENEDVDRVYMIDFDEAATISDVAKSIFGEQWREKLIQSTVIKYSGVIASWGVWMKKSKSQFQEVSAENYYYNWKDWDNHAYNLPNKITSLIPRTADRVLVERALYVNRQLTLEFTAKKQSWTTREVRGMLKILVILNVISYYEMIERNDVAENKVIQSQHFKVLYARVLTELEIRYSRERPSHVMCTVCQKVANHYEPLFKCGACNLRYCCRTCSDWDWDQGDHKTTCTKNNTPITISRANHGRTAHHHGHLSKGKAREMLHNPPHGRPLTPKQRRFFGHVAFGSD